MASGDSHRCTNRELQYHVVWSHVDVLGEAHFILLRKIREDSTSDGSECEGWIKRRRFRQRKQAKQRYQSIKEHVVRGTWSNWMSPQHKRQRHEREQITLKNRQLLKGHGEDHDFSLCLGVVTYFKFSFCKAEIIMYLSHRAVRIKASEMEWHT